MFRAFHNMSSEPISRRSRRSTRVPLKVLIEVQDCAESLPGETIMVNLHGALISISTQLSIGMTISVYVYLTDKRAKAQVVYIDPENPMRVGIELDKPRNIWGVPLPPDDWKEAPDP
jgi:PilZ domain